MTRHDNPRSISSFDDEKLYFDPAEEKVRLAFENAKRRYLSDDSDEGMCIALALIDEFLDDPNVDYAVQMYQWIWSFLDEDWARRATWDWLRNRTAMLTNVWDRAQLDVAIFSVIAEDVRPEEPIDLDYLDPLLTFLNDDNTAWAVFSAFNCRCAYEFSEYPFPENLRKAFREHQERLRNKGADVPSFPERLLSEYVSRR